MASDLDAPHLEHVHEFRGVLDLYFEEQNRHPWRDVVVLALLPLLPGVLLLGAVAAAVGDEVDVTRLGCLLDEAPGRFIHIYSLLPELGGALDAGHQGDSYDRAYKEEGYGDAIGSFVDVGSQRVNEDYGYYPEENRAQSAPAAPGGQRDGEGGRGHHG